MSTISQKTETPDELDKLFSDFFKAQLKRPWPNAPLPAGSGGAVALASEPSELVTTRTQTETPSIVPATAPQVRAKGRDGTARARFTLVASVALALGTCWVLSNGFLPEQTAPNAPGLLRDGGADGNKHDTFKSMQENKAKSGDPGRTNDKGNNSGTNNVLEKSGDE